MKALHQPGDVVRDRYRIMALLGQGGMGSTYQAEDLANSQLVAVKALSLHQLTEWKALELFEREAKVLETLNHPQIPAYLAHFEIDTPSDRCFYLVQELAEGDSLATLVERGWRPTEAEVKDIARQVLEILDYLHRLNPPVIHRDIKPQNLIRRADGRLYLVDFGAVQAAYRSTLSGGSTFVGTFGYMPPEQFRGQAYFASDLYALGGTLLFLLTHHNPADLPQKRMQIQFRDRLQLSEAFADWLEKMLEPAIEDRFQSAQSALAALRNAPVQGRNPLVSAPLVPIQKPRGSRIRLQRSHDCLSIEIPAAGIFHPSVIGIGLFALAWNGFLYFWTTSAISMLTPVVFPLFSIPFWLVGLALLGKVLMIGCGSCRLEIEPHSFQASWSCLGFGHRRHGQTADLVKAAVDIQVGSQGQQTLQLVYWEGIHKHSFGQGLTRVEQEWLAAEISDFLAHLRR